jgi:hypothetical protein
MEIKLRNYFAGLAMQSLISNRISGATQPPNPIGLAKEAYLYADAMLEIAAIKVPPPKPTPYPFNIALPELPKSGKIRP